MKKLIFIASYRSLDICKRLFNLIFVLLLFVLPVKSYGDNNGELDKTTVLTLKKAQKLALKNNPDIKNMNEVFYQAEVLIQKAWAILLPNINTNGSVTRNDKEISMSFPDLSDPNAMASFPNVPMLDTIIQEKWGKNFGFTANMTLFNARSIPLLQYAYSNLEKIRVSSKHVKNKLLYAVAMSFYPVYTQKEILKVANINLQNAKDFLNLSQAKLKVGQGTRLDVMRSESQVMQAEKDVENAKDNLKAAKIALSYLTGIKGDFSVDHNVKPNDNETLDFKKLSQQAMDERLDVKSGKMDIIMAEKLLIETWTKWLPNFDVTYNWTWNSAAGFGGENDSWRLIFGAKWAILEGGIKLAELAERKSFVKIAKNNLEKSILNIKEEIENQLIHIQKIKRNIKLSKKQIELLEETYRLVTRQYELGMATSLDVSDISTDLSQIKMSSLLEQLQYDLSILSLNSSLGKVFEMLDTNKK